MKSGALRCTRVEQLGRVRIVGRDDGDAVLARASSATLANQMFSLGSSRCVTTSAHVDAGASSTCRQRTPTSW